MKSLLFLFVLTSFTLPSIAMVKEGEEGIEFERAIQSDDIEEVKSLIDKIDVDDRDIYGNISISSIQKN